MIEDIRRVTAGKGGEVALIIGSEKTAVYDAGMAFWGSGFIKNIKKEIGNRPLDYVLLTHTHYDHLGGIPYLRNEWPGLIVYGSEYGKGVLERPGALAKIRELSEAASRSYLGDAATSLVYKDEDLRIDVAVKEGDKISLGDRRFVVYQTKGHTKCSLSYYMDGEGILFTSESTGVLENDNKILASVLTSYKDAIDSVEKCRSLNAKYIFSPHYLQVSDEAAKKYWDMALREIKKSKDFIFGYLEQGFSPEEILEISKEKFWTGMRKDQQPIEAFLTNMKVKIDLVASEYKE